MRWSRRHTPTPLSELMDSQPAASDTPSAPGARPDEETQVRLWPGDYTGDPAAPATSAEAAVEDTPEAGDSFLDDEDYLPQERRGPGRLTIALVAALVLAVGVLGGVWVQKQLGTSSFSAGAGGGQGFPGGTARGAGGAVGGEASGGARGGAPGGAASGAADGGNTGAGSGGAGGQTRSGSGGAGGQAGSGADSSTAAAPAVVGTVSKTGAKSLVVTDLGGTEHTVTLSTTTTVTAPYAHGSLKAGDTVAVTGTAADDGSVTATGLTVS